MSHLTSDSGSCANWYARDLKIRRGMMASLSGGLASMGAAVPYAIAAKFAHPDRPVIALVGDGAMQMNNMAELITVAKYWREWADPRWIVCVFNNYDLNQVTWEQRVMKATRSSTPRSRFPNVPYHRFAELIGLEGIFVDDPEAARTGLGAGACGRPAGGARSEDRPRGSTLAAAHHLQQAKNFSERCSKGTRKDRGHLRAPRARCWRRSSFLPRAESSSQCG